jgi:hypothetical protein
VNEEEDQRSEREKEAQQNDRNQIGHRQNSRTEAARESFFDCKQ